MRKRFEQWLLDRMHGITSYQNVELRFVLPLHYTPTSPKRTLLSERPEVVSATHSTGITPSQRAQSVSQLSSNVARQESPTHLRKRKNREKPAVVPTENCQDEVKKALRPILRPDDTDSCYVLLCRGKPMDCLIQPVKIPNTADEEQTWKLINAAWYELRGKWTRHVPFFGVKAIDVVQVSIAGLSKPDNGNPEELELQDTFRGIYSEQDISAEEKRLQEDVRAGEPRVLAAIMILRQI